LSITAQVQVIADVDDQIPSDMMKSPLVSYNSLVC
jgi:hypothetical protein